MIRRCPTKTIAANIRHWRAPPFPAGSARNFRLASAHRREFVNDRDRFLPGGLHYQYARDPVSDSDSVF
jgi:hypothetical protein